MGDAADRVARMAAAGAILYLHRLHFHLRDQALDVSREFLLAAVMSASVGFVLHHPALRLDIRPHRRKRIYLIGAVAIGIFGFAYFAMLDTAVPRWIFLAIVISLIPHDMMYGPQAALIAECFSPRLRYTGASLGYHLASIIAGGPAPLIAAALLAQYRLGLCGRDLYPGLRDR